MRFHLIHPWHRVTCAFCFHRFHLADAPVRPATGTEGPDEALARFLRGPAPPMVLPVPQPKDGWRRWITTPDDPRIGQRVCPKCHLFIPRTVASGDHKIETIALVGARSSGKSNYIGMLINQLEERYRAETGFALMAEESFSVGDMRPISSRNLHIRRYGGLFDREKLTAIPQSASATAAANQDIRFPLIYRLQFAGRKRIQLVLFDAAGEDLEKGAEEVERLYPYVAHASGIIFLLDPLGFGGVRDDLQQVSDVALPAMPRLASDPLGIVEMVAKSFEIYGGHHPNKKLPIPVALVLSKADVLKDIVRSEALFLKDSRHEGGFNEAESAMMARELRGYMADWTGEGRLAGLEGLFADTRFFAMSALGQTPTSDFTLAHRPRPQRVGDPLLWLLYKLGYLPPMSVPSQS